MPFRAAPKGGCPPLEDVESVRAGIRERLAKVRATLAPMSGKGGVCKSAVAVNLALALAQRGARVGLLDGEPEFLVIDLAPGPDRVPRLRRLCSALAGVLAVTIPTGVSLPAVERSIRRAHAAHIPVLGLIESMGSTVCTACSAESPLSREAPVERRARELDVPVLARIPFDRAALAAAADAGRPFVNQPGRPSQAARPFAALATRVAKRLAPPVEAAA